MSQTIVEELKKPYISPINTKIQKDYEEHLNNIFNKFMFFNTNTEAVEAFRKHATTLMTNFNCPISTQLQAILSNRKTFLEFVEELKYPTGSKTLMKDLIREIARLQMNSEMQEYTIHAQNDKIISLEKFLNTLDITEEDIKRVREQKVSLFIKDQQKQLEIIKKYL